jgi:hypothetical protein
MSLTDSFKYDDDLEPTNEELLNIIREQDQRGVGTSEIVSEIDGLKQDAVRNRLRGLEAEDRVESDTVGSEDDFTFIWYLAENEREEPVNPDLTRLVDNCEQFKFIGRKGITGAKYVGQSGMLIIILTLTTLVEGLQLPGIDPSVLLYAGWLSVVVAAAIGAGSGALIYLSVVTEWVGEQLVERESAK